jgi:16S rRNA (guanine527-N7)-methyltransferase
MNPTPAEFYQRHRDLFDRYQLLLLKWNQKINLTAITDPSAIVEKHFLDSLSLLPALIQWLPDFFPANVSRETFSPEVFESVRLSVLDIGSGAGFPGIPLKVVTPQLQLTLVDSVKKKCDFLKEVVRSLSLTQVKVRHETLKGQSIGAFDVIATRATFDLKAYLSLAVPNLKPGGIIIAMKGLEIEEEMGRADEVLKANKLKPFESVRTTLAESRSERQILMTRY